MKNLSTAQTKSIQSPLLRDVSRKKKEERDQLFLSESDGFSAQLKAQVNAYFSDRKISTKANLSMYVKTALVMGVFVFLYAASFGGTNTTGVYLTLVGLLGFVAAIIGFTVSHDAVHGAYSRRRWVNVLMGESMSLIGGHVYNWKVLHNIIHHTYTGIVGGDGDLHPFGVLRFHHADNEAKPYHRFQHIYAPLLYTLTSLVWVFRKDFDHYFKERHLLYIKPKNPRFEFSRLILSKAIYLFLFIGLPLMFAPVSTSVVILGFFLMHGIQGLVLASIFQLGHVVEGPYVTSIQACEANKKSWMTHQLVSTANFATQSKWVTWITGGLNHQIEHHLFPTTCHVHYPAISKIVKKLAAQHGLPYLEYGSYAQALKSHFRFLRECGRTHESGTA